MTKAQQIVKADDLILGLADQAEKEAAALAGGQRLTFPYLRIATVKEGKSGQKNVVEVVNPAVRDEKNNAAVTRFDSLNVVILQHILVRRLRYTGIEDGKPRMKTELFSVGPKKGALAVGTAVGGVMSWDELTDRWPDGFDRSYIPYGTEQVTRGKLKPESRYYVIVGLSEEAREAAGSDLAFVGLSMTSTYGISIDAESDFEDMSLTLLGFPNRNDPEGHKGVLHQLANRPWQLGLDAGLPEDKARRTPQYAIWVNLIGTRIGNVPTAVHGFELGEELTREQLVWAKDAEGRAEALMQQIIEQDARDAYPAFAAAQLPRLSQAAVSGDWGSVGQTLRLAAPVAAEVVEDDAPIAEAEDLGVATVGAPRGPAPTPIDDEFPDESELPF
jgi:hypothetical protein